MTQEKYNTIKALTEHIKVNSQVNKAYNAITGKTIGGVTAQYVRQSKDLAEYKKLRRKQTIEYKMSKANNDSFDWTNPSLIKKSLDKLTIRKTPVEQLEIINNQLAELINKLKEQDNGRK